MCTESKAAVGCYWYVNVRLLEGGMIHSMSGTPIVNRLEDLYSLLYVVLSLQGGPNLTFVAANSWTLRRGPILPSSDRRLCVSYG